ncbi:MAG: hypothetical protein HY540_05140 [Deltaproteobacteria bacterium]|nr:hypothetical protein [Deltaproteobacteria bacterium]
MTFGLTMTRHISLLFCLMFGFTACATQDVFPDIGTNMASPTGLAVDSTARRLYVTNANSEVSYDWQQGSFQVLDITSPAAPTLVNTVQTRSYSGKISLDPTAKRAYVTNRFSSDFDVSEDRLFSMNIDESTTNFLSIDETVTTRDPFATACCVVQNRLLLSTAENALLSFDVTAAELTPKTISLRRELSNGVLPASSSMSDLVVIGDQAFISRASGGIFVVNLNEIENSDVNPVDYFIADVRTPRGLATDGTNLLVADEDIVGDTFAQRMLILDISSLMPDTDNTQVTLKDKDDDGLLQAAINVGKNPQQIVVAAGRAFVTNADDDMVSVIDLTSRTVVKTITVGDKPFGMAIDAPNNTPTTLYVGNLLGNNLSIIDISSSDPTTFSVVARYPQ